jgi:hypothetical protein
MPAVAPPFGEASALAKVQLAEDLWNTAQSRKTRPGLHRGFRVAQPDRVPLRAR